MQRGGLCIFWEKIYFSPKSYAKWPKFDFLKLVPGLGQNPAKMTSDFFKVIVLSKKLNFDL